MRSTLFFVSVTYLRYQNGLIIDDFAFLFYVGMELRSLGEGDEGSTLKSDD